MNDAARTPRHPGSPPDDRRGTPGRGRAPRMAGAKPLILSGGRDGLAVREHLVALALVAVLAILPIFTIFAGSPGDAPSPVQSEAAAREGRRDARGPGNDRDRHRGDSPFREPCGPNLQRLTVDGTVLCVAPPLPAPRGLDAAGVVPPLRGARAADRAVQCVGDGVSGPRIEALYVYDESRGSRYGEYRDSFQGWLAEMDGLYDRSAQLTGGSRHVRFVTDANCRPEVREVGAPAGSLDDFAASIAAVRAAGHDRPQRHYLMFVDANVYCGIGTVRDDDRPGQENLNNLGGGYARVDRGCWGGFVPAHESMHTLGAVQLSAPHSTGAWHCTDERDIMCYSDQGEDRPPMQQVCTTGIWARGDYFDCNHDDYFNTNPAPGSYLATHWNVANSAFLVAGTPATDGEITLSDGAAPPGTELRADVSRFPAGARVELLLDDDPLAGGTAGGDGAVSIPFAVPEVTGGPHRVRAVSGAVSAGAPLEVLPGLRVPAGKVKPGASVVAEAAGFEENETIAFTLDGTQELARVVARVNGSAVAELAIPAGTGKGVHAISARGDAGSVAEADVTIGKKKHRRR